MLRRILHVDMDAFYASVEQHDDPSLRGKPLIVGGSDRRRGVVAAASYEARRFGVRSAMPTGRAYRLCPELLRVPPRPARYSEVSEQIRDIFLSYTRLVEPLSLDESFLDVSTVCDERGTTATRLALEIKQQIRQTTGLTASAGVAPNKFVAKIASDYQKPDGLTVVVPERVLEFLHPLPVSRIWGIGPKTNERLKNLGVHTVADLYNQELEWLVQHFGKAGLAYYRLARGQDERPVVPHREPKSLSTEETFSEDVADPVALLKVMERQAGSVARRLQRRQLQGTTVVLKLRYGDFTTVTRSTTLPHLTDVEAEILENATTMLRKTEFPQRAVRLVGIGVSGLMDNDRPIQLTLF